MVLGIILAIVIVFIFYAISSQRQFIKLEELVENSLSQIGVQQQSRWDALRQIAKAAKGYAKHEAETLDRVISARSGSLPKTAQEVQKDDNQFTEALSRLNFLVEQYPELKADSLYSQAMTSIGEYEEKVRTSRMVYNDTVTKYNRLVKQIPSSIVAKMFGFEERPYLETNQDKADMPELDF